MSKRETLDCLRNEVRRYQSAIDELEAGRGLYDKRPDPADGEVLKGLLSRLRGKAALQAVKLLMPVLECEDPYMRSILYLRDVCGKSWADVAREVGGGNLPGSVRMAYKRYKQKCRRMDSGQKAPIVIGQNER